METSPSSPEGLEPDPKHPRQRRTSSRGPWFVAILALLIAIVAAVLARSAASQAQRAEQLASELKSQAAVEPGDTQGLEPSAGAQDTAEPVADPEPVAEATPVPTITPPDVLDPQADYRLTYSDEILNPQPTNDSSAEIDLDEPRVGPEQSKVDIVIDVGYDSTVPVIRLEDGVAAAEAPSEAATPADCADLIRTGPVPDRYSVPAQRGTVLCIATSREQAAAQGINQKLVVLHVTELGADGRVTLHLDAWEVPQ